MAERQEINRENYQMLFGSFRFFRDRLAQRVQEAKKLHGHLLLNTNGAASLEQDQTDLAWLDRDLSRLPNPSIGLPQVDEIEVAEYMEQRVREEGIE